MSTPDSDAPIDPLEDGPLADREDILRMLEDAMNEAHRKVESGRVRDAENEKVRQGWFRVLGYLAGQHRHVMKDKELEEMQEEIELLKEANRLD
jgi:hypothetical protein